MGSIKDYLNKKNQPVEETPPLRNCTFTGSTEVDCTHLGNATTQFTDKIDESVLKEAIHRIEEIDTKNKRAEEIKAFIDNSLLSKVRPINKEDIRALVHGLVMFETLVDMCTADGSISSWGCLPQIGADVITAFYGTSGLFVVAGVQPIDDDSGKIVYVGHERKEEDEFKFLSSIVMKPVTSKVFVLEPLFERWVRHRFGMIWQDEAAKDLVTTLMHYLFADIAQKMLEASPSEVFWDHTPPPGISYYKHKQTFKNALCACERKIYDASGKHMSFIIAGHKAVQICRTLSGYVQIDNNEYDGNIIGLLDSIPIVAAGRPFPENKAIIGYRRTCIEAPVIVSPYMLLAVHYGDKNRVASHTAIDVVAPNLLSTLTILEAESD